MSERQGTYTAREIIDLLDVNYGFPCDGELSDIFSEHSEIGDDDQDPDFDIKKAEIGENSIVPKNLHAAEVVEEEESTPASAESDNSG